jgi:hypothetical protein
MRFRDNGREFVDETAEENRKTNNGGFVFSVVENTLTELVVKTK